MKKTGQHVSIRRIVRFFLLLSASFLLFTGCTADNFNDIIDRESIIEELPVPGNSGSILVSGITADSVILTWNSASDDSTPAGELQYMVVKSLYDNISTADTAMANGTVSMEWSTGFSTHTVTGLNSGEISYLNILVKDSDGYISAYTQVSVITEGSGSTGTGTVPVPGDSGALSISAITGYGFTLAWTKAADAETAEADLQYRVYYSLSDDISTYSDALTNGTETTLGWTLDINTMDLTGLSSGTTYYVNLFVRDPDGNISPYTTQSDTTLTVGTAPVPGNSGTLTVSTITSYGFTLGWTKGTDADTDQEDLLYRVYYSLNDDIDTYANAQSNGTEATSGWTLDADAFSLSGLAATTLYYVNLFVRDGDDMVSAYAGTSTTTGTPGVYLFSAGNHKGDLGGRTGADTICQDYFDANWSSLPVTNVRAFISIDSSDQISDFPSIYGIPGGADIMGPTGIVIANGWTDLTDGDINNSLLSANVGSPLTSWWSGSEQNGNSVSAAAITCNGFTDGTNIYGGYTGAHNVTDMAWITYLIPGCNSNQTLMCVGW
jgi:hypothetical protein